MKNNLKCRYFLNGPIKVFFHFLLFQWLYSSCLQLMNCSGLLVVFFLGNFFSWRTVSLLGNVSQFDLINYFIIEGVFSKMIKHFIIVNLLVPKSCWIPAIIPCLMQVVGLVFIPESPRWLVSSFCDHTHTHIFSHFETIKVI